MKNVIGLAVAHRRAKAGEMGSGGATRWAEKPELRAKLEQVVANISHLQGGDGFAMAFLRGETNATLEHLFKIFVQRSFELWKAHCPPKFTSSPSTFTSCRLLNYHRLCGAYFRGPQIMSI